MDQRWNNPILSWWPLPIGTALGPPAAPAQPVDEGGPALWPTTIAQASWMPPTPISPNLAQGGLFSSFDAGTTGGLFGRLAPHSDNSTPARDWGVVLAPPSTGVSLMSAGDDHGSTPDAARGQPFPSPPSQPPLNASMSIAERTGGSDETVGASEVLSDVTRDNYWIPGADYAADGHHHSPRGVYRKFALPEETRRVFDKATTGPLPFYKWHEYDELHRMYNDAVGELMSRFMKEHDIKAEQMTPDHARAVLKAIAESDEPRIRIYRSMLQLMGRLYRLRSGARGNE